MADSSANEILASMSAPSLPALNHLKKKEKQSMKHQAFLSRLPMSSVTPTPYSRSHNRREKRKQKERLVAKMDDLDAALEALGGGGSAAGQVDIPGVTSARKREKASGVQLEPGKIGEGKGSTLSASQRKAVL
ncbi:hypothetical protein DL93DRAFT_2080708 [Clavulina sp. PMI_390]|nr:hypothetical protein DL93DRAFT_2080708 [Clavulina sp. PMI_390]